MAQLNPARWPAALLAAMALCGCGPAPPGADLASAPMLGRTEVTTEAYARCVAAEACTAPKTEWATCNWSGKGPAPGKANHPVNCVDGQQAAAYCKWVNGRLPTEAEWLAAVKTVDESGAVKAGICAKKDDSGTCPVGASRGDLNAQGVADLLANVKEWTSTRETLPGTVEAWVFRGAGWRIDPLAPQPDSGLTNRESLPPTEFAADLGFRCLAPP